MFGIEALYTGETSNKSSSQRRKPVVEEDNVVGFDEEAKQIVSRLNNISESLEVVSVVGMGGLVKTTLAKKVYCDPAIEFYFFVRAWVKCYGLPLAIVVVAGLLLKKDKTRDLWKKVAESVSSYVARDPKQSLDVLALSYKHLPDHLKVCFIYFGAFPEDFEIPVWKLLMLWVAEGFIQQKGQDCLEDLAEEYLDDLVERNLILVAEKRSNGRIKTCRVHDMLRDLCLREAAEEIFLHVIKGNLPDPNSLTSSGNYHRRLYVHSHVMNFIHSKPCGPHVRSFLCFPSEEKELSREHTSFIHEAFKLVRVLDIKSINISHFPVEITQLVHLRYISLFGNFKVLPPSISKLWSLQSLIIETTSRDLNIQVDIWKMSQFRHLRASGLSHLHGPQAKTRMDNEDPFVQRNIQTISTVSPNSCTENVLARTPNLKKLGVRGKLTVLMEEKKGSSLFDNLAKLNNLENVNI
nr:putative late blight resistance protein homolog R1B-14 [Tanacetum cinerariifolium]